MITQSDIHCLATWMINKHGRKALFYAECAIGELEAINETRGVMHWKALGDYIAEMLDGRIDPTQIPTKH